MRIFVYVIYSAHCCFEQKIGVETLLLRGRYRIIIAIRQFVIQLTRIKLLFVCLTLYTEFSNGKIYSTNRLTTFAHGPN